MVVLVLVLGLERHDLSPVENENENVQEHAQGPDLLHRSAGWTLSSQETGRGADQKETESGAMIQLPAAPGGEDVAAVGAHRVDAASASRPLPPRSPG